MSLQTKAKKITLKELEGIKYMHADMVVGLLGAVVRYEGMSICQEVIDGMKDAIIDYFFDGCDPEWESYGIWQWFENMSPDWFTLKPNDNPRYAPQIQCSKKPSDFKK